MEKLDDITALLGRRYVLQTRDDNYVERVESTKYGTVDTIFHFTPDIKKAKTFSYDTLFSRQATRPIGIQFSEGFAVHNVIRVK